MKKAKVTACKYCKKDIPDDHPRFMKIKEGRTYEVEYQVCMACKGRLKEARDE